jgi:hypothetical protein
MVLKTYGKEGYQGCITEEYTIKTCPQMRVAISARK